MCAKFLHKKIFLFFVLLTTANLFAKEEKIFPKIKKIIVSGNKHVNTEVILNRLPYKINSDFDESKSSVAVNNIYALGFFRQITIEKEPLTDDFVNLYLNLEEKKLLEKIEFKGNKAIRAKKIKEDLNLKKISAIDEEQLERIAKQIKKMYAQENYHKAEVSTKIIPNKQNPDKATALFEINEGEASRIVRVLFKGNKNISDRKLRGVIFTREDWIFNFIDDAGQYQPDALEMDKHRIEYFYKDYGYMMATVGDVNIEFSKNNRDIFVTFHIKEGDKFDVRKINIESDDLFTSKELLEKITLEENKHYSQTKLVDSINNIKDLYGQEGYIYADVYPQIVPDEETKQVDVSLHVEKGKKLYVNRINITGNVETRDKVIRRELDIAEGDLITTRKLNKSKANVEYLSFFERGGVNWKIHRVSDDLADLEMNVQETKTGSFQAGLNYGSDQNSPQPSLRGSVMLEKKNLFGYGWDAGLMVQGNRHGIQKFETHFFEPNLLDTDVSAAVSFYRKWEEYELWRNVTSTPKETTTGGDVRFGFQLPKIDKRLQLMLELGVEDIRYKHTVHATSPSFEPVVKRRFCPGTLNWLGIDLIKDTRNHQVYPNNGYKLMLNTKTALPFINQEYSFFKVEADGSWYTPIIGDDWLVFALHGKAGSVHSLGGTDKKNHKHKMIPYKELFHMGGQTTVRGFVWGSIGPAWINDDPLGGRYAVQFNSELIFPLIPDYSMKGHFFYDAGAGWNTPKDDIKDIHMLKRDKFKLRHSVGFGLNLLKPMPAKIDWGYKLDRDKKAGESPHEFHLSMNYAW